MVIMWKLIRIRDQDYKFKVQHDDRERKFLVHMFAFEALWNAEVNDDEVVNEMKILNELLEFDEGDLITEMISLFDVERTDVHWIIGKEDAQLKIHLTSTYENIEYSFKATLYPSDSSTNFYALELPAFIIIKLMGEFLKKKDAEILEYRMNGATTTRKSIETPVFNEDSLTFPPELLNTILSNTKDIFDNSMISYLNQVQSVIGKKLHKNEDTKENQIAEQCGKVNEKELADSNNVPISKTSVIEPNQKSKEQIRNMTFHKMKSNNTIKSRPVKKLKGL